MFSSVWLLGTAVAIVFFLNLYISLTAGEPHWFQRSGSIIVVLGIMITARRIIRLGKDHLNEDMNYPDETAEGRRVALDEKAQYIIGPVVALLGTMIWGYGDLMIEFLYD